MTDVPLVSPLEQEPAAAAAEWQLFIKTLEGRTAIVHVPAEGATVAALKIEVHNKTGTPVASQRLIFAGKCLMDDSALLADAGIENESHVMLVLFLLGGAAPEKKLVASLTVSRAADPGDKMNAWLFGKTQQQQQRTSAASAGTRPSQVTRYHVMPDGYRIELTNERCMYTMIDDDAEDCRAKMPCGHGITSAGLTDWMDSIIDANQCYEFKCMLCKAEWPYPFLRRVAQLTPEQKQKIEVGLSRAYAIHQLSADRCLRCGYAYCLPESKTSVHAASTCVRCPICLTGTRKVAAAVYEFCVRCKTPWNAKWGQGQCQSDRCSNKPDVVAQLRDCPTMDLRPMTSPEYASWQNVPVVRACPTCATLITHAGKCKHMTCPSKTCGTTKRFCFVCLSVVRPNGTWECGDAFKGKCLVAPRQTLASLHAISAARTAAEASKGSAGAAKAV